MYHRATETKRIGQNTGELCFVFGVDFYYWSNVDEEYGYNFGRS